MPALMKAFPYITDHYRTSIHIIIAVWTTLSICHRNNILTCTVVDGELTNFEPLLPIYSTDGWYMGSSSRPLLELQRSARIIDGKVRLPQLTEQAYLRGDDVVAEFKLQNLNTEK